MKRYGAFLFAEGARRAECLSWLFWLFWQVGSAPFLGGGFGHFYACAPTKMEYPIDRQAMEVKRQLDVLDRRLAERCAARPGPVDYAQIPELAQRGLARLRQFLVMLNKRLAGRDFIAAYRFSVADITAVVTLDFARMVKVRADEQQPHLQRWRTAMAQRQSMSLSREESAPHNICFHVDGVCKFRVSSGDNAALQHDRLFCIPSKWTRGYSRRPVVRAQKRGSGSACLADLL